MTLKSPSPSQSRSYSWRLPQPEGQAKLKPLDFSALDTLFADTKAFQELDRPATPRQ